MSSHSNRTHTFPSGSPLPSLRAPPAWTHATQNLHSDSRKITPSLQAKRVKISSQRQSHRRTNYTAVIDLLPDELLLGIFDHIRRSGIKLGSRLIPVWKWHVLVHVCRRWRQIVFASPIRLDLQLLCTYGTPVRKYLACWPAFPIVVDYDCWRELTPSIEDSIMAALEHRSRIRQINLNVSSSLWSKMATVMQKSFPSLNFLSISTMDRGVPVLPRGFLGGSAPRLQGIRFHGIPTSVLPTFLSYTSHLAKLELIDSDTDQIRCIAPVALVACLAMLPKLKDLSIAFTSRTSQPVHLPRRTRVLLPTLTSFSFDGERAYLEDFVAQIDTPTLDSIDITFQDFPDPWIPQLSQFINRTAFKTSRFEDAKIYFDDGNTIFLYLGHGHDLADFPISIKISSCDGKNHQVWSMAQVLRQTSAMVSNVVRLEIILERCGEFEEEDEDLDDINWLELLCQFTAVATLHISEEFAERIAHALEEAPAETGNQVLPVLDSVFLEGNQTNSTKDLFAILQDRHRPFTMRY
ncbi:hypothetical protein V8E53_011142 [Lactarius tabidus]